MKFEEIVFPQNEFNFGNCKWTDDIAKFYQWTVPNSKKSSSGQTILPNSFYQWTTSGFLCCHKRENQIFFFWKKIPEQRSTHNEAPPSPARRPMASALCPLRRNAALPVSRTASGLPLLDAVTEIDTKTTKIGRPNSPEVVSNGSPVWRSNPK